MYPARCHQLAPFWVLCLVCLTGCTVHSRFSGNWVGETEHASGKRAHLAYLVDDGTFIYQSRYQDTEVGESRLVGNWSYDPESQSIVFHTDGENIVGQVMQTDDSPLVMALPELNGIVYLYQVGDD